jgi:hydrogenase expression/formation protein HypD
MNRPDLLDGFRDRRLAAALQRRIAERASRLPRTPLTLMEVCGTHTVAIARFGLRRLLPPAVRLVSGPGCPVCVTDAGFIDAACELARRGMVLATFGDMLRVPGTAGSLAEARAAGGDVRVCLSPLAALEWARGEPGREVVLIAVGFETTTAPLAAVVARAAAEGVRNLSLLTACKTMPAALDALLRAPDVTVDGFLCPPHVSAIIGAAAYRPLAAAYRRPLVVAGFEPLDILDGIDAVLAQAGRGAGEVENRYTRVVHENGNPVAQALVRAHLEPEDAAWRGLGVLPGSGLRLRPAFAAWDARVRHGIEVRPGKPAAGCRCGDVLRGRLDPGECALFGRACTPASPVGPCMVSAEGSCAARYRYDRAPADGAPSHNGRTGRRKNGRQKR